MPVICLKSGSFWTALLTALFLNPLLSDVHGDTNAASPHLAYSLVFKRSVPDEQGITLATEKKTYWFSPNRSVVEDPGGMTIIDFDRFTLTFVDGTSGRCEHHELLDAPPGSGTAAATDDLDVMFRRRLLSLMGSYRIHESNQSRRIGRYDTRKCLVQFGADLVRFKMTVAPVVEHFSRQFTANMCEMWITENMTQMEELMDISNRRRAVYQANPLILQIAFLGLLPEIKGFPVQIIYLHTDPRQQITETLVEAGKYEMLPPVLREPAPCACNQ